MRSSQFQEHNRVQTPPTSNMAKDSGKKKAATKTTASSPSKENDSKKASPIKKIVMKTIKKEKDAPKKKKSNEFEICLIACATDGNKTSYENESKNCIVFAYNPNKDDTYASGFTYFADTDIEAGKIEDPRFAGPFLLCEQSDPNRAMTDDKGFFCKAIIVQGDPEKDDSVEYRRSVCEKYMQMNQDHHRNIFNDYIVKDDFDKTPVGELQPLNRYVTTKDVIRFVKNKYDIAPDEQDETWARSHALEANNYFSGPIYPRVAIRELGYVKAF